MGNARRPWRRVAVMKVSNYDNRYSLEAHRKLDPLLKHVDLRLQIWAPWAKPYYGLGYPHRSSTECANMGDRAVNMEEWPKDVVLVDQQVARLPTHHAAAVMGHYFYMQLPFEIRAQHYFQLARYLARTRPKFLERKANAVGVDAFRRNLDRARWSLRLVLNL